MTYASLLVLGRQPAIGRAELESLYGADALQPVGGTAMLCSLTPSDIDYSRLGSSIKLCKVLGTAPLNAWQAVLERFALSEAQVLSEGSIQMGLSAYGLNVSPQKLNATGLSLKKHLRCAGYSVRLVPAQGLILSSAQVLHNHLSSERGMELVMVRQDKQIIIAKTVSEQDINAYAARDQNRPKRDPRIGMLPPKLAQTMINLANGSVATTNHRLLDPFCGTGVILQEALLMGFEVYGTDLEPRMIDYSLENIAWLTQRTAQRPADNYTLAAGDATTFQWQSPVDLVASETYLGRPLSTWPEPAKLQEIIGTCNTILEKSLRNLAAQLKPGTRLCLAVPAWKAPNGRIHHLPLLDLLNNLGYNRIDFKHARTNDLIYARPEQLVARELIVITRK